MEHKVKLKYEMGAHKAGDTLAVVGDTVILETAVGGTCLVYIRDFPQLFEEVKPVLKEVRLVSIGKSVKGGPVPASAEGIYLKGDPGFGFVPVSPERYGLAWNWERDLFRAEEIYE